MKKIQNINTAYVLGVAIGDGNLSNPNGRAVCLRVTCDDKYPGIKNRIKVSLQKLLSENKVSEYKRPRNCSDIYCYSNKLEEILGWKSNAGSKFTQNVTVPKWIFSKNTYIKHCLKGLIETDGSLYYDRNYLCVNFTTIIYVLAVDVKKMINKLGYSSSTYKIMQKTGKYKYIIRIFKRSEEFISEVNIIKN